MIRKLTRKNHDQLIEYLSNEKAMNLFIIGDVEAFGYDSPFQELWADFNDRGDIQGVLLRFYNGYIPYAKEAIDVEAFASIMLQDEKFEEFSGKESIVEHFEGYPGLRLGKKMSMYFAECIHANKLDQDLELPLVKRATLEDVSKITYLRSQITEFSGLPDQEEKVKEQMIAGVSRTYYIEQNEQFVAAASTVAENSMSAMVVGVCALPEYRQMGYATQLMNALCKDVLQEGKTLCLFYNNPKAGSIYHRIGFEDIGRWVMYR
jgi:uncharacterized protein